jgi:hypothetical protein
MPELWCLNTLLTICNVFRQKKSTHCNVAYHCPHIGQILDPPPAACHAHMLTVSRHSSAFSLASMTCCLSASTSFSWVMTQADPPELATCASVEELGVSLVTWASARVAHHIDDLVGGLGWVDDAPRIHAWQQLLGPLVQGFVVSNKFPSVKKSRYQSIETIPLVPINSAPTRIKLHLCPQQV